MPDKKTTTRKLRAILSADVKGYSLLMADDEAFTIQTIKKYRNIISSTVEQHAGRVVDTVIAGDQVVATDAVMAHLMGHDPESDWLTDPFLRDRNAPSKSSLFQMR